MQEEVESRSLTLAINTAKLTGRTLKSAISKLLAYRKNKKAVKAYVHPQGKQSVKKLIGQNQGVSSIELADGSIRDFEHVARKYGVDFAIKKDKTGEKPRYLVFFKARDADALTAALKEYAGKKERRPSVLKKLRDLTAPPRKPSLQRSAKRSLSDEAQEAHTHEPALCAHRPRLHQSRRGLAHGRGRRRLGEAPEPHWYDTCRVRQPIAELQRS